MQVWQSAVERAPRASLYTHSQQAAARQPVSPSLLNAPRPRVPLFVAWPTMQGGRSRRAHQWAVLSLCCGCTMLSSSRGRLSIPGTMADPCHWHGRLLALYDGATQGTHFLMDCQECVATFPHRADGGMRPPPHVGRATCPRKRTRQKGDMSEEAEKAKGRHVRLATCLGPALSAGMPLRSRALV